MAKRMLGTTMVRELVDITDVGTVARRATCSSVMVRSLCAGSRPRADVALGLAKTLGIPVDAWVPTEPETAASPDAAVDPPVVPTSEGDDILDELASTSFAG